MLSYLHGIRPNGRRNTPLQVHVPNQPILLKSPSSGLISIAQHHSSTSPQNISSFESTQFSAVSAIPPVLPPIRRVASQYGSDANLQFNGPESTPKGNEDDQIPTKQSANQEEAREDEALGAVQSSTSTRTGRTYERSMRPVPQNDQQSQEQWQATEQVKFFRLRKEPKRSHTEPMFVQSYYGQGNEAANSQNHAKQHSELPVFIQAEQPTNPTASQSRHGKPRLNILNPMLILGRRRTAQTSIQASDHIYSQARPKSSSHNKLPDDYDPRIRGKVVHDFSAPRPSRYGSPREPALIGKQAIPRQVLEEQNSGQGNPRSEIGGNSSLREQSPEPQSVNLAIGERQHTPIFKEHFGDEIEPWRFDSNDRRNQNTTGLLDRMPTNVPNRETSPLPPFARNFPADVARNLHMHNVPMRSPPHIPEPKASEIEQRPPPKPPIQSEVSSTTTVLKSQSHATSTTDPLFQSAGHPRHLKSNASRFSFDLAAVGSAAQEKLLEDKHRQKSARRARESTVSWLPNTASATGAIDEDGDSEYDNFDFDDGLEEKMPGVNADADGDADGFSRAEDKKFHEKFHFTLPNGAIQSGIGIAENRNLHLQDIVYAADNELYGVDMSETEHTSTSGRKNQAIPYSQIEESSHSTVVSDTNPTTELFNNGAESFSRQATFIPYEDDLYYDDGLIDDIDDVDAPSFDESVFDDETNRIYGLPLRDLKPLPKLVESPTTETSQQSTRPISSESAQLGCAKHIESKADVDRKSMPPPLGLPLRKRSLVNRGEPPDLRFNQSAGLTQDNLEAYHSALAQAANRANREGRFDRKTSLDEGTILQDCGELRKLRVSFEDHGSHHAAKLSHNLNLGEDSRMFDFDDEQDDDAIIAAANAEALENDDEGFYGQEFGFFAHATGSGEALYANGGYFGPAGFVGVKRNHSGKANFQEPTLTPITERSEWSQRNSMISPAMQNALSPALQKPGLAQLADAMQYEDDNMSLSALLKLRRGAFGGSNGSLQSIGSQRSGSPQRYNPPSTGAILYNVLGGSHLAGSSYSLANSDDTRPDEEHPHGSPALTLQTQGIALSHANIPVEKGGAPDSSPRRRNAVRGLGHSRNSSGAESVSYVKEIDEDGTGRWVLEKRRMSEGGQMEILGRQIVEGGRI